MTANTGPQPGHQTNQQPARTHELTSLDRRYGAIGILAVAAALRYAGTTKNAADAPVALRIDLRFVEMAA